MPIAQAKFRRPLAHRRILTAGLSLFLTLAVCTTGGCVERRLTVRTNPPGAQLYVDNYEIGTTPVSTAFVYYGTREIRLVKDGYETLVIKQPIPAPWYEYLPFDFITENVVPGHIRDERVVTYQLRPAAQVPQDQLLGRAEALRQNGKAGALAANAALGPKLPPGPPGTVPLAPGVIPLPAPGAAPTETLPPGATLPPPGTPILPGNQLPPPGQAQPLYQGAPLNQPPLYQAPAPNFAPQSGAPAGPTYPAPGYGAPAPNGSVAPGGRTVPSLP